MKLKLKLAVIFVLGMIGLFGGHNLWDRYHPLHSGERRLLLEISQNGKFLRTSLVAVNDKGQTVFEQEGFYRREYVDVPAEATKLRIGVVRPTMKRSRKGPQIGEELAILREVPLKPVDGPEPLELRVDTDPHLEVSAMSWLDANWNSYSTSNKITVAIAAIVMFLIVVMAPLSLCAAVYSLLRERRYGIQREFCGHHGYFLLGLLLLGVAFYFHWVQPYLPPRDLKGLICVILLAGYPLYYVGELGFERGYREQQRREAQEQEEYEIKNTEFHIYKNLQTGHVWNDRSERQSSLQMGYNMAHLFRSVFLPVGTYHQMYAHFLRPLLEGTPSWREE